MNKMSRLADQDKPVHIYAGTRLLIEREKARRSHFSNNNTEGSQPPYNSQTDREQARSNFSARSEGHYRDVHDIPSREHMSEVDPFDGEKIRGRTKNPEMTVIGKTDNRDVDLLIIHPVIDDRLLDKSKRKHEAT